MTRQDKRRPCRSCPTLSTVVSGGLVRTRDDHPSLRQWLRWCRYQWRRLFRIPSSPYAIAVGCSAGVFISFTPLVGFHLLLAAALAFAMRGSLVASAVGTVVGNPLTFPFIWLSSYKLGALMLNIEPLINPDSSDGGMSTAMLQSLASIFWPMMAGGTALGILAAIFSYAIVYSLVAAFRHRRHRTRASPGC
jgi:uncharacterized protein (DUF2062 family)